MAAIRAEGASSPVIPHQLVKILLVALALGATTARAATIGGTFQVTSAQLVRVSSAVFDGPCAAAPVPSFFTCAEPLPTGAVSITNYGGGSGLIEILFDDSTGEVRQVTDMALVLNDFDLSFASPTASAAFTIRQGNAFPGADDRPVLRAGTGAPDRTADADQNAAAAVFQHAMDQALDAPAFFQYGNVVDSCAGTTEACALGVLFFDFSLRGVRYEIEGTVSGGIWNGSMRVQTGNGSNYFVDFESALVPVPPAMWLFVGGLGALAALGRRTSGSTSAGR